jgi:hypothetical protein
VLFFLHWDKTRNLPTRPGVATTFRSTTGALLFSMSCTVMVNLRKVVIPKPIKTCFDHVLRYADTVGIFRVLGSARRVLQITTHLLQHPDATIAECGAATVHDVATVIKRLVVHYLRATDGVFVSDERQLAQIRHVCQQPGDIGRRIRAILDLPRANTYLIIYLTDCLGQLAQHEARTQMSAANLAVVFQPHFFACLLLDDLAAFKPAAAALVANGATLHTLAPHTVKVRIVPRAAVAV